MAGELVPVRTGPGRPPKPDGDDVPPELLVELRQAEVDRAAATAAFRTKPTIAHKCRMLETEIRCAQACAARCRLEGNYTHALKFGELVCKLAGQHATASDQKMADEIKFLEDKLAAEERAARG